VLKINQRVLKWVKKLFLIKNIYIYLKIIFYKMLIIEDYNDWLDKRKKEYYDKKNRTMVASYKIIDEDQDTITVLNIQEIYSNNRIFMDSKKSYNEIINKVILPKKYIKITKSMFKDEFKITMPYWLWKKNVNKLKKIMIFPTEKNDFRKYKTIKNFIDFNDFETEKDRKILSNCSEKFINFLKSEKVYEKFIKNLLEISDGWKENWITDDLCDNNERDYILSAFYWDHSDEGQSFWDKINNKWIKLYLY
jgi:hypothetical protein